MRGVNSTRTSRRSLLLAATVGAATLLTGCGPAPTATPAPPAPQSAGTKPPAAATGGSPTPATAPAAAQGTPAAAQGAPAGQATPAAAKPATGARAASIKYQQRDHQVEDFVRKVYGPQFEKETGTKVVIEDIPSAEYFQKVAVLSAANQLGDLVFGWTYPWLPSWASKNMLRPLDDFVAQEKYDLSQFYRGVIDGCRFENKLYALPTIAHAGASNIFFNRRMLQQAGVKPPDAATPADSWKWDDILTAATALTKQAGGKTDVWGWLPSRDFTLWTMNNLRAFGTDLVSQDGLTSPAGNEQGKAAYRYYHELIHKHKVTPSPSDITQGVGLTQLFVSEKLAMFQEATFLVTSMVPLIKDKFEWGVFVMPPGPAGTRGATIFGNTTSVTSQAKEAAGAWEFLKYITTREVGVQKLLMNSGSPGARPDVFQDPRLVEPFPWFKVGHKAMEEAKAYNIPANVRTQEIFNTVPQTEQEIWLNKIDGEAGALKVQQAINDILKQPR